jgi:hypothetical protein
MTDAGVEHNLILGDSVLHDGLLLDLRTSTYRQPPAFLGTSRNDAASTAGAALFVWGGTGRRTGHDLADGYLLYP